MRYFNLKSVYGTETIDQIDPKDFNSFAEYRKELNMLIREYRIAGMNIYISRRCTNDWKNR